MLPRCRPGLCSRSAPPRVNERRLAQGLGCPPWGRSHAMGSRVPCHVSSGFLAASLLEKSPLALSTIFFISWSSSSRCCLPFPELVSTTQGSVWVSCGAPPLEQIPQQLLENGATQQQPQGSKLCLHDSNDDGCAGPQRKAKGQRDLGTC